MKLGIVRQRYTPFGGAERFVARAMEALAARGVGLRVYTRRWPASAAATAIEPVICDPFYIGNRWRDASFARAVKAALARDRPDLVQTHERIDGCDIFRAGDGVHRVWLEERLRAGGAFERLAIAANGYHRYVLDAEARVFADPELKAVICISQMVKDDVRAHFPIAERKLHVIYNAVDPAEFGPQVRDARTAMRQRQGFAGEHVVFLLVGSGYARKGVPAAIRSLARLPAAARLVVVGRDKHQDRYRALAARLGVADRVLFAGPQVDPKPWYGAADAFVLPTLYDPLSNAVLEALACGLPVVTSTRCGAGERVREFGAGTVCPATDIDAIAAGMRELMDEGTRADRARRATAAVAALTPAAMSARLLELYGSLLPGQPGAGTIIATSPAARR
jgi:UDP-glucose:(heptosyl)LPS alpha-1,3-glucosyltransferase